MVQEDPFSIDYRILVASDASFNIRRQFEYARRCVKDQGPSSIPIVVKPGDFLSDSFQLNGKQVTVEVQNEKLNLENKYINGFYFSRIDAVIFLCDLSSTDSINGFPELLKTLPESLQTNYQVVGLVQEKIDSVRLLINTVSLEELIPDGQFKNILHTVYLDRAVSNAPIKKSLSGLVCFKTSGTREPGFNAPASSSQDGSSSYTSSYKIRCAIM